MKVLHLLASNVYSGAENVVCQIIDMFKGEIEMAYCSPDGDIANTLSEKQVKFFPLNKLSLKNFKKVVKEFKPDIIHAHDIKAILLASLIDKNITKIGHVHVNDKEKMSKFSIKSLLLKFASKKFKHLFWVSNSCLKEYKFKSSVENKSSVLYNVINEKKLEDLKNLDNNVYDYDIVYLGRLTYQKDPLRLLQIAKLLKEKNCKFKMAIIGSGDMKDELIEAINAEGLADNVYYLGFMRNAYKLLSNSKLMLMSSRFEGTPMCALESLALGVPIVTTKTDGMIDLIKNGENGFVYDSNEQAVEAIEKLLNEKETLKQMKENCVKFSNEYNNIETYKENIRKVYTK